MALLHNQSVVATGKIEQVQLEKQNVTDVGSGRECGLKLKLPALPAVGDILQSYREEIRKKKLIIA